jgi:sucrose-6-phosphate hydrolase SacC (GH32 family)
VRAAALILAIAIVTLVAPGADAAWMIPAYPYRAKDFTLVKKDGWFHLFYIRNDTTAPFDSTERDLGHAISRDLYNWIQFPPVLAARPDHWDNAKIWAPSIVQQDGVYYMFYTGVTNRPGYDFHQQIGVATSTDLMTWNRFDEPVFSCAQVPWTLCDTLVASGGEFRDPFVMSDGQGGWLMYYNTRPASNPSTYVAGVATSPDLMTWTDLKPMWITQAAWSGSALVESPHLFRHGDTWYFLFTGDGGQPLRWATGADPIGDPGTWTYRGTLSSMLGVDTQLWFASELLRDGLVDYLVFADYDRTDFRRIEWHNDGTFALKPPALLHVWDMSWTVPTIVAGQNVGVTIKAVNAIGQYAHFTVYACADDGSEVVVPNAEVGFPDSLALTKPTTTVNWSARTWPVPNQSTRLIVRSSDLTAGTAVLTVCPPIIDAGSVGVREGSKLVPHEQLEFSRVRAGGGEFRTLSSSPVGGIAMLVDLAAPAGVRIDLYDLAGRHIRNLADRTFPAGATVVPWDARTADGTRARPGVYFARIRSAGSDRTLRILLAH